MREIPLDCIPPKEKVTLGPYAIIVRLWVSGESAHKARAVGLGCEAHIKRRHQEGGAPGQKERRAGVPPGRQEEGAHTCENAMVVLSSTVTSSSVSNEALARSRNLRRQEYNSQIGKAYHPLYVCQSSGQGSWVAAGCRLLGASGPPRPNGMRVVCGLGLSVGPGK